MLEVHSCRLGQASESGPTCGSHSDMKGQNAEFRAPCNHILHVGLAETPRVMIKTSSRKSCERICLVQLEREMTCFDGYGHHPLECHSEAAHSVRENVVDETSITTNNCRVAVHRLRLAPRHKIPPFAQLSFSTKRAFFSVNVKALSTRPSLRPESAISQSTHCSSRGGTTKEHRSLVMEMDTSLVQLKRGLVSMDMGSSFHFRCRGHKATMNKLRADYTVMYVSESSRARQAASRAP